MPENVKQLKEDDNGNKEETKTTSDSQHYESS